MVLAPSSVAIFVLATANGDNWATRSIPAARTWGRALPTYFVLEDTPKARRTAAGSCGGAPLPWQHTPLSHRADQRHAFGLAAAASGQAGTGPMPATGRRLRDRGVPAGHPSVQAADVTADAGSGKDPGSMPGALGEAAAAATGTTASYGGAGAGMRAGGPNITTYRCSTPAAASSRYYAFSGHQQQRRRRSLQLLGNGNDHDHATGGGIGLIKHPVTTLSAGTSGGGFDSFALIATDCSDEYHGQGPCCKCAFAVWYGRHLGPAVKWLGFIDDDVFVRPAVLLPLLAALDPASPILVATRAAHEWRGPKGKSCDGLDVPGVSGLSLATSLTSDGVIVKSGVKSRSTTAPLSSGSKLTSSGGGGGGGGGGSGAMVARAQPAFFSAAALEALLATETTRAADNDETTGDSLGGGAPSLLPSPPHHSDTRRHGGWSKGQLVSLCGAFGITHDDGVGVWAWLHGLNHVTLSESSYVAKGSGAKTALLSYAAGHVAMVHRVRGTKSFPSMDALFAFFEPIDAAPAAAAAAAHETAGNGTRRSGGGGSTKAAAGGRRSDDENGGTRRSRRALRGAAAAAPAAILGGAVSGARAAAVAGDVDKANEAAAIPAARPPPSPPLAARDAWLRECIKVAREDAEPLTAPGTSSSSPLPSSSSSPEGGDGSGATASTRLPRLHIIRDVCIYILVMELAERLCFYTFTGSINVYLRDYLGFSQAVSSAMVASFNTLVYVTPLVGGYIADAHWGRFWAIAVFGGVYLAGMSLMAVSSLPGKERRRSSLFMVSFFGLVALGAGGIKSNVVTMGGDQFDLAFPEESAQKDTYFTYFYFMINVGALFSYLVMAQMATEPTEFGLDEGTGFFYTFIVASATLALALVAFFSAHKRYVYKPPSGSAAARYCKAIWAAAVGSSEAPSSGEGNRECGGGSVGNGSGNGSGCLSSKGGLGQPPSTEAQALVAGTGLMVVGLCCGIVQPFVEDPGVQLGLTLASFAIILAAVALVCWPTVGAPRWVERTGGKAAMLATRVLPVLFNTVSYNLLYAAVNFFTISACQMDVSVTIAGNVLQVNSSFLNTADCVAIILAVPLLDSYGYPAVDTWLGRKVTCAEKYLSGLSVGMAAVSVAALLEVARRGSAKVEGCDGLGGGGSVTGSGGAGSADEPASPSSNSGGGDGNGNDEFWAAHPECFSRCAFPGTRMSSLPVWWMLVPYFMFGVSECLANIPLLDLCYSQTPPAYRSMAQALSLFITALGSMLAGAFTTALSGVITDNLDDGHLEYFYLSCVAFCVALVPANLYCFRRFEELDEKEVEAAGDLYGQAVSGGWPETGGSGSNEAGKEGGKEGGKGGVELSVTTSRLWAEDGGGHDGHDDDDDDDEEEEEVVAVALPGTTAPAASRAGGGRVGDRLRQRGQRSNAGRKPRGYVATADDAYDDDYRPHGAVTGAVIATAASSGATAYPPRGGLPGGGTGGHAPNG